MIYSQKKLSQIVIEYCVAYQIEHVIISPGSRNAPLIIGFTNHPQIKTYSIVDERCAAFFALGIAQQVCFAGSQAQKRVALVCTSGSALLNYYPAIAEAFYSDIPLIIISADRPKYLIDIGDGQTIRQENVFKNHSLYNANLVDGEQNITENTRQIATAIQTAIQNKGPVHINVPFDEPLYETTDKLSKNVVLEKDAIEVVQAYNLEEYASLWNNSKKKLVLVGARFPDKILQAQLVELIKDKSVLVFTETTSNMHHPTFINSIDQLIFPLIDNEFKKLQPDILLTLGGMIVSKKVKQFLRKYQPKHHWHIDDKNAPDTYHCLSNHFKIDETVFFDNFLELVEPVDSNYQKDGLALKLQRKEKHNDFLAKTEFSDLKVFDLVLDTIPNNSQLQLGNSSIIRYSQLFDVNNSLTVFCNRGTSGIDGSTSTAIGASHVTNNQTVLITGDISFFYDSNALWNNYIKNNFRIILINNGGGGIFRFIPGPSSTNVFDYFETPHHLTAEQLCEMYHFEYYTVKNEDELKKELKTFYQIEKTPKLLEVFTLNTINDVILKRYFNTL
jgi:2-succinyl-5-enolpyruvyl-6-hydroxy-3-cyclohexene-1-carboxylate synthase